MRQDLAPFELASFALACRDVDTLLRVFAARARATLDAETAIVWGYDPRTNLFSYRESYAEPGGQSRWVGQASAAKGRILEEVYDAKVPRLLDSQEPLTASLAHLEGKVRSQVRSVLYLPLAGAGRAGGVIELLNKLPGSFTEQDVLFWGEAGRLASQAISNLEAQEQQRQEQMSAVERLTALYDLGRTFTSTLELHALLPVVARKIREVLAADICNLWLIDARAEELCLHEKSGADPTVEEGARASANEGLLAEVLQQGIPKLLTDPAGEDGLRERRQAGGALEIRSWMAAPLKKDQDVLGLVEILNQTDGAPYTEDDLFFLSSISEQAAVALHNAQLLESERKASALNALLKISQEITSTLDLDQVLSTVVNQARTVLPFDRCAIGYFDQGQFVIGAVSGEAEVPKSPLMEQLRETMEWIARQAEPVSADWYEAGWRTEPQQSTAKILPFLEGQGYNGCFALPLQYDQEAVGAILLLSANADFLTANHREILAILAGQSSIAIRNSQLYSQLPLASILRRFAGGKQRMQSARRQGVWARNLKWAGVLAVALCLIPWPIRVPSTATIVPAERRIVSTIEGGVIERVFVREGDTVHPGDLLALVNDGEDRVKLAEAEEALESARRELGEGEFRNDPSTSGQARMRADLHLAEVQFEQKRVGEAHLRAPIAGVVVTPKVEEKVGSFLGPGETFAEIVGQERMAAELSVRETDLPLVRPGRNVTLKLNAFPTLSFLGTIERVGAQARSDAGEQYFVVRAVFSNPGGIVRDGMVGRARTRAAGGWFDSGWYPVGYALLRDAARWLWTKAWALLP